MTYTQKVELLYTLTRDMAKVSAKGYQEIQKIVDTAMEQARKHRIAVWEED